MRVTLVVVVLCFSCSSGPGTCDRTPPDNPTSSSASSCTCPTGKIRVTASSGNTQCYDCRAPCTTSDDCPAMETCSGNSGEKVCWHPNELNGGGTVCKCTYIETTEYSVSQLHCSGSPGNWGY